jgi:hypothetical protein
LENVRQEITIEAAAPLLDRQQPAMITQAGRDGLSEAPGSLPGRSVVDVVTSMPGWLVEANAVLHPRGSEYDTQYVIDGMPLYDNRSINVAPAFETREFEQVNVLVSGIPAEFGRRLGGVIALDTTRQSTRGRTSELDLQAATYDTRSASLLHGFRADKTSASVRIHGGLTDRFLDPPSQENFTNHFGGGGFDARLDREVVSGGRLNLYLRSNRSNFLVPNTPEQQQEGQRQDRRASETAGQVHYQHVFSSRAIGSVRGMVRDLTALLWSNPFSEPAGVGQNRGFRESAIVASTSLDGEHHSIKAGGDFRLSRIRERFALDGLDFRDRRSSREGSAFVQDHVRWGGLALHAGLRADGYSLLVRESALSPRLAASYYVPKVDVLLRASCDRVFQPPPMENLLLSSAAPELGIDEIEDALPVPASRAHFFEVGVRKPFGNLLRLDVSHYWRRFRNFQDDDVFLNTGISFPITFDEARIQGTEVRLEMPRWRGVSSYVSYSNMTGSAKSPVTGGLFIEGGEADELRGVVKAFPVTQDQRNTVATYVRLEPQRRLWLGIGARYGSGLPFEAEEEDDEELPDEILDRVDFSRGRIRPNFSLNLTGGLRLFKSASLQAAVTNVTDRLNLINFSGLFSGTAIAPGRQATLRLSIRF